MREDRQGGGRSGGPVPGAHVPAHFARGGHTEGPKQGAAGPDACSPADDDEHDRVSGPGSQGS